jgi:hypothetical protein
MQNNDSDLGLPIRLTMGVGQKLFVLALGALMVGASFLLVGERGTTTVSLFRGVPKTYVGYLMLLVGAAVVVAVVVLLVANRPWVTLEADGVTFAPNFGAARRIAWSEIVACASYDSEYGNGVKIRTRNGRTRNIPSFKTSGENPRELIVRCAAAAGNRGIRDD